MTGASPRATAICADPGIDSAAREASAEELLPLVYDELHRLARGFMHRERSDHTLQPTALVHEAYLKLVDQTRVDWQGRTHFYAVGARAMRRILIDHARGHGRQKRAGDQIRVTLLEPLTPERQADLDPETLLTVHHALEALAEVDEREARVVELKFFGGLEMTEIASVLGVSKRTVEGDWTHARAWLRRELAQGPS